MLSKEGLARIVKDEIENLIRNGYHLMVFRYILLNGSMYLEDEYDEEVEEGKHSSKDIYALVEMSYYPNLRGFLFYSNYHLALFYILRFYLQKKGFTIVGSSATYYPTPNLKYYIISTTQLSDDDEPEYLITSIYDFDIIANSLGLPQLVEQKLGNKPRKISPDDVFDIDDILKKQPILAGHTYDDAYRIMRNSFIAHKDEYKKEATKLAFAFTERFPISYRACYEWEAGRFNETDCLKIELRRFSS